MVRPCLRMLLASALAAASLASVAAPADDHQRGLQAYQRGDVTAAMSALRAPAKAGHAPSQSLLAFILEQADFREEAFALYREAAAQDDADAHAGLAGLYLDGRGVAKDEKAALQHFSKAAELGHAMATQALATAYLNRQLGLQPEGRDAGAAIAAWRRAAEAGHVASADALARAYRAGSHGLAADVAQAASWQARAAQLREQQAKPMAKAPK